jgi:hypothetical protein
VRGPWARPRHRSPRRRGAGGRCAQWQRRPRTPPWGAGGPDGSGARTARPGLRASGTRMPHSRYASGTTFCGSSTGSPGAEPVPLAGYPRRELRPLGVICVVMLNTVLQWCGAVSSLRSISKRTTTLTDYRSKAKFCRTDAMERVESLAAGPKRIRKRRASQVREHTTMT